MDLEALQKASLDVASERSVSVILQRIVGGLVGENEIALARVWLIDKADRCGACTMRSECRAQVQCLHLVASAGTPLDPAASEWDGLDGAFSRFPLGVRKIGHIGASGDGILVNEIEHDGRWIVRSDWAIREGIRCFAGQPLVFRGETLGVLGVFSRQSLGPQEFAWLRLFADHAAVAIANSRAFEEIERLRERLELENASLKAELSQPPLVRGILGRSPSLLHALHNLALVAPTDASVLITGESGSGKELFAQAVHAASKRCDQPLVAVNCSAVPRELFESEFFGHVRGSFSGAIRDRLGRFQLADRGTLFLDEVGEIPLELQGKLLRALQEGSFERVGDDQSRSVNVRVIAATNRDLRAEVAAGRFRQDLFFRLSVFPLEVPPLRERRDDIPVLCEHFICRAAKRLGLPAPAVTRGDLRYLQDQSYPGNVRELEHMIERALIAGQGHRLVFETSVSARAERTPALVAPTPAVTELRTDAELRRLEHRNLMLALERAGQRIYGPGGAAELLGLKPTTLVSRMKVMGLRQSVGARADRP